MLAAHTLPYALHKKQSDEVVQQRSPSLRGCSVYILRPHIFAGASVENYLMGAFRGTPNGKGARAEKMRAAGKRLPCMLPRGQQYLDNKIQFVHVDDMARLIQHILQREPEMQRLTVLNVAGRGEPLTFAQCIEMAKAKLVRVPGKMGNEPGPEISLEESNLRRPAGSRALHHRRVHHEYRLACAAFWAQSTTTFHPPHHQRCLRRFLPPARRLAAHRRRRKLNYTIRCHPE